MVGFFPENNQKTIKPITATFWTLYLVQYLPKVEKEQQAKRISQEDSYSAKVSIFRRKASL